jgi:hypothetical protein
LSLIAAGALVFVVAVATRLASLAIPDRFRVTGVETGLWAYFFGATMLGLGVALVAHALGRPHALLKGLLASYGAMVPSAIASVALLFGWLFRAGEYFELGMAAAWASLGILTAVNLVFGSFALRVSLSIPLGASLFGAVVSGLALHGLLYCALTLSTIESLTRRL